MQFLAMLGFTATMLCVGWFVWKAINVREEGDLELQKKLDDDDRRAAIGRGELPPDQS